MSYLDSVSSVGSYASKAVEYGSSYIASPSQIGRNLTNMAVPIVALTGAVYFSGAEAGPLAYSLCVAGCTALAPPAAAICVAECLPLLGIPCP